MENIIDFYTREKVILSKLTFIKMASHEFRSPLATILSSVNLLDRYQRNNDRLNTGKHIQRLKDTVGTMRNMLEYFMAMNFSDNVRSNAEPLPVKRLNELIECAIEEYKEGLKSGQQIKFISTGTMPVCVNHYYLLSIIKNLLCNAIKYSFENQIIWVKLFIDTDSIRLYVRDKGVGISAAEQSQIRKKHFDSIPLKSVPGTGLGLYIVSRYLELLAGNLEN